MWCVPSFSHLRGTSSTPSITLRVRKRFLYVSNSDQMGGKKNKSPSPFFCLSGSNSQHLGTAKQMMEKHHPAGAVTPQPLLGLAAFLPHFPGSQNVLELLPRGLGAGKLISAQPSPGERGLITSFLTKQMLRSINKRTNPLSYGSFGDQSSHKKQNSPAVQLCRVEGVLCSHLIR